MSVKIAEIPKDAILDETNFTDWKIIITSVLAQYELDEVVTVKSEITDTTKSKEKSAMSFLLFSMNREHRNKITHCKTSNEIWTAIISIYENKSKRAINTLWKKLFNYKITLNIWYKPRYQRDADHSS